MPAAASDDETTCPDESESVGITLASPGSKSAWHVAADCAVGTATSAPGALELSTAFTPETGVSFAVVRLLVFANLGTVPPALETAARSTAPDSAQTRIGMIGTSPSTSAPRGGGKDQRDRPDRRSRTAGNGGRRASRKASPAGWRKRWQWFESDAITLLRVLLGRTTARIQRGLRR